MIETLIAVILVLLIISFVFGLVWFVIVAVMARKGVKRFNEEWDAFPSPSLGTSGWPYR